MRVNGVELESREIAGAAPTLVFLHEGLGSVGLWREFPERLAAATGRRALLYSRAGHGFSDAPSGPRTPRFMHEEALDVLPALLAEAGIADDDPAEFRRYGSARRLYNFDVDDAGSYE